MYSIFENIAFPKGMTVHKNTNQTEMNHFLPGTRVAAYCLKEKIFNVVPNAWTLKISQAGFRYLLYNLLVA